MLTSAAVDTAQFPDESVVGYAGPTPTGAEAEAIQTGSSYPYTQDPTFRWPLIVDQPQDNPSDPFDITEYWGNLSPVYSVQSSQYGLNDASPLIPDQCSLTQVHILYRHGARYPTSGSAPAQFAAKLHAAANNGSTWSSWGDLDFLNHWKYELGAELLSHFGRLQNFELGVGFRQLYGGLLNNFTESGKIPVFRTESQDRMVKTAENFAAGFFGVPDYINEVSIELMVEADGVNNTGAPYDTCTNANGNQGSIGSGAAAAFAVNAFNSTLDRLNSQVQGIQFTPVDITSMLQLCAYETDNLGYSQFCKLFTSEDFRNFEYYFDVGMLVRSLLTFSLHSGTTTVPGVLSLQLRARGSPRSSTPDWSNNKSLSLTLPSTPRSTRPLLSSPWTSRSTQMQHTKLSLATL